MKRSSFLRQLKAEGCILHREGSKHSIFFNPENGHLAAVPRHSEIEDNLTKRICRQLDVRFPLKGS